jgi:hypothetical protein
MFPRLSAADRGDGNTRKLPRRKLSTRNLGVGVAAVVGGGLGFATPAYGLLGNRYQYWPTGNPTGASSACANVQSTQYGPKRNPSFMSDYGRAGDPCGPGGSGYNCVAIDSYPGGQHYYGIVDCTSVAGHSKREQDISIASHNAYAAVQVRGSGWDNVHHMLEGVSRRSF